MSTTQDLINRIKVRASIPTNDNLFSTAEYLQMLLDEYISQIIPLFQKANEEYFLSHKIIPIVAGQTTYRIPAKSISASLRDVQLIDQSENIIISVNRLYEEDRSLQLSGYYLVGNKIELSKDLIQNTQYSLRLPYFKRPSRFVLPSACAEITEIDTNLNTVTVASLPSNFSTSKPVDILQASSPYDFISEDETITNISGLVLTFNSLPSDLAIGDYICLAGESCVPTMLPLEAENILVQATLCSVLSSKKDKAAADFELQKLEMSKQSFTNMIEPRVKSSDQKITNRNSLLNHFRR